MSVQKRIRRLHCRVLLHFKRCFTTSGQSIRCVNQCYIQSLIKKCTQSQKPLEFTTTPWTKITKNSEGIGLCTCIVSASWIFSQKIFGWIYAGNTTSGFWVQVSSHYPKSAQDSKEKIMQCFATLDFWNIFIKFFSDCLLHWLGPTHVAFPKMLYFLFILFRTSTQEDDSTWQKSQTVRSTPHSNNLMWLLDLQQPHSKVNRH